MRTLGRMALTVGLVAVLAGTASAQRQRGGQGRGGFGGGFGGGGVGFLISNEAVQKELKMDKDQADKATEAVKKVREKHADDFSKLRDVPQEERRAKMQELSKEVNEETLKAVGEVLKPEQMTRLKQIELQRMSFAAFTRPEVQEALKLTTEQKEKVKTISDKANKDIQALRGSGGPGGRQGRGQGGAGGAGGRGQGRGGFGANNEKVTAIRKEADEKIVALLTDDQKKTWKGMTGDAFDVPLTRPAPKKDD
jgi:hypothetical protein